MVIGVRGWCRTQMRRHDGKGIKIETESGQAACALYADVRSDTQFRCAGTAGQGLPCHDHELRRRKQ